MEGAEDVKSVAFVMLFRKGVLAFVVSKTGAFVWEEDALRKLLESVDGAISQISSKARVQGGLIMKKLALMAVNTWLSYLLVSLQAVTSIVFVLGVLEPVYGDDFFCASGDVTCLIANINSANGMLGEHVITLDPGIYALQIALPMITGSIRIQASADDPPTVIEPGQGAQVPILPTFQVSVGGELTLEGITVQGSFSLASPTKAILNRGVTTLQDTIITENRGEGEAIRNNGTLNIFRSIIADNVSMHDLGGILNEAGGNVLIEDSTIAHNQGDGAGGILNQGKMVVRNSSIIFNAAGVIGSGSGIRNSGYVEILNSTIAKNRGGGFILGGGGIENGGQMSITNSTIRENEVFGTFGGGIENRGILQVQNTIVAGNTIFGPEEVKGRGPDCSGTITSLGNNLFGDLRGCDIKLQPSDLTGDPGLGALVGTAEDDLPGRAFYPVLAGSPVIDKGNPNACLQTDQLGNLRVGICDIGAVEFRGSVLVSVDIRPKKDANRINPNSTKNVNVAIFSVNGFDATTVHASTVRFGATGIEAAPIHGAIRDVDGDGRFDMALRFAIQDMGIGCGATSAALTGQTSEGLSIIGSSPIKTVQCRKQR